MSYAYIECLQYSLQLSPEALEALHSIEEKVGSDLLVSPSDVYPFTYRITNTEAGTGVYVSDAMLNDYSVVVDYVVKKLSVIR